MPEASNHNTQPHFTMLIEWSDINDAYVVTLPEWEERGVFMPCTHGSTYIEAAQKGMEVLETLIEQEEEHP